MWAVGRCGVSRARDSVTRLQLQSTLPLTPSRRREGGHVVSALGVVALVALVIG
jgi:hypothetical protein